MTEILTVGRSLRMSWFDKKAHEHDADMVKFIEQGYGYDIPPFPKWIEVSVVFPFHGLFARVYFVDRESKGYVSTYLDVNGQAGAVDHPYFETYPIKGDAKRYDYDEQKQMYKDVLKELRRRRKGDEV